MKYFKIMGFSITMIYLVFPQTAYAYLNPGTGSFILQLFIGALVGVSLIMKIYWKKCKCFFTNLFFKKAKYLDKNKENE